MDLPVSPLAPKLVPNAPALAGVGLYAAEAGIKYRGRTDVLLITFDRPARVAGVFTKSRCPSAPVDWCRQVLAHGKARAVLINAGNANAFTGMKGWEAVRLSAEMVAETVRCPVNEVYLASTGVIGEPLDAASFEGVLRRMGNGEGKADLLGSARAIMTTDTFPKVATQSFTSDGRTFTVNGIAKGSGMIAPDMATMLSFIVTDLPVETALLQKCLKRSVDRSFNAVTVDSDTSTSDTVLLFSVDDDTGAHTPSTSAPVSNSRSTILRAFQKALDQVCIDLAQQIARDGEGASTFVEVRVLGAKSKSSAHKVAMAIANSPLVKTAIAGEDANWGRVVMAVGKAGEPADRDKLAIWFGDVRVAVNGERDPTYSEDAASAVMKEDEVHLTVDLGIGRAEAVVWTCDLTKQYVAINGDYRS